MPSDKSQRKQVVVDRDLLEKVRARARKFQLSDSRDAAVVDAALRDWLTRQNRPATLDSDVAARSTTTDPGHEHRLQAVLRYLIKRAGPTGRVGPIGYKTLSREMAVRNQGNQLSPTFLRRALAEMISRGELEVVVPRAGSVGAIYKVRQKQH